MATERRLSDGTERPRRSSVRGSRPSRTFPAREPIGRATIQALCERAISEAVGGRPSPARVAELAALDRDATFSPGALGLFLDLLARLGLKTVRPIPLPIDDRPFWQRTEQPLSNYRSTPELPRRADIVIVGAGLTGASAAYQLRNCDRSVVVIDRGDPAGEASGRNGGNFALIPENSVGIYSGLAAERLAFMRQCHPGVPIEILRAVSERQASAVLDLAVKNREVLRDRILEERIDCDFSPRGWLHIAASEAEEQGICDEVALAAQHGQKIEIWSRGKIRAEFGFEANFLGRFISGDGTYHPLKFVTGTLTAAIRAGVALHTRVNARRIVARQSGYCVETDHGSIDATAVILATNAFTRELVPELTAIKPYQSQVMVTEHVPNRTRGRSVTSDLGPVFFNQHLGGAQDDRATLLMGGGPDRPMPQPSSRRRSGSIHAKLMELRDAFFPELVGQPPSAEWVGPIAFTPDGLPCIGFLSPGLVVAAGCNGYGGSYATAAGTAAADMALTGNTPAWVPEDVFSPLRLTRPEPVFLSGRTALWRIAELLSDQLDALNRRVSEELTLRSFDVVLQGRGYVPVDSPPGRPVPSAVGPRRLRRISALSALSDSELKQLEQLLCRWDLARGTLIFTEGSRGGSCYFVLAGKVDVSIERRSQRQLLATLGPGSIFGQVSLVKQAPRSATCSVRSDAVLLELTREPCERLLGSGSPFDLKVLAVLNDGLISALRNANKRLMRIATAQAEELPSVLFERTGLLPCRRGTDGPS